MVLTLRNRLTSTQRKTEKVGLSQILEFEIPWKQNKYTHTVQFFYVFDEDWSIFQVFETNWLSRVCAVLGLSCGVIGSSVEEPALTRRRLSLSISSASSRLR